MNVTRNSLKADSVVIRLSGLESIWGQRIERVESLDPVWTNWEYTMNGTQEGESAHLCERHAIVKVVRESAHLFNISQPRK